MNFGHGFVTRFHITLKDFPGRRVADKNLFENGISKIVRKFRKIGWSTKFGMIKCRTTDIPEFQNYEY